MDGTKSERQITIEHEGGYSLLSLLRGVTCSVLGQDIPEGVMVSGVTADSRKVETGSLFVALAGSRVDGHAFLDQVMASGSVAVVVEEGRIRPEQFTGRTKIPFLHSLSANQTFQNQDGMPEISHIPPVILMVADSHLAYAQIAANLYGQPARGLTLVGVTGTNGKTTVSYLLESVLKQQGYAVGVIGTVNYRYSDALGKEIEIPAPFTTPEPLLLQRLLREMANAGVTHVLMEVSSHALAQRRLGDLQFDVVAFTNLSRDHLDYHRDMDEYFAAKSLLFANHLKEGGKGVINRSAVYDSEEEKRAERLVDLAVGHDALVLQCGRVDESDIYPLAVSSGLNSTTVTLRVPAAEVQIATPLVGDFNVANLQTVLGIGLALSLPAQTVSAMLGAASGAPGRLQRVMPARREMSFRPAVFVDYAHTPDALEKVLEALSRLPHRRLICVFGCGGDRDQGKRPIMGEIAGRFCDVAVITDDNPRTESPQVIVTQIVSGVRLSGLAERTSSWLKTCSDAENFEKGFLVLHDRAQAIAIAITSATAEDIVLIAGKGHERYQQTINGRRFFDDSLVAKEVLSAWKLDSLKLATAGEFLIEFLGQSSYTTGLDNVVIDSRKVEKGDVFVALAGERFDGHDFLDQVVSAEAGALVLRRGTPVERFSKVPCLFVDDTQRALGDLAAYRRQVLKDVSRPLVVGITGSCGKTTVKEMTAAIFAWHWQQDRDIQGVPEQVLKTRGNFNNLIGLPLSLLPIDSTHKAVILEMGMNRPGEIDRLARIADPDIACIVNVHAAHLEGLRSIEGVALAKEELFAGSGKDTILVVNLDDPHVRACAGNYQQKKVLYAMDAGMEYGPQVWPSDLAKVGNLAQSFVLHVENKAVPVILQAPGVHNVSNAVAAAAIGHAAGISIEKIAAGLGVFQPADKRMQIVQGKGGLSLLNDTYNANPASMRAGLATLGQQGGAGRMAILGDMLELGPTSVEAHTEVGRYAAGQGLDYLALVGDFAAATAAGAMQDGMESQRIKIFTEKKDVAPWVEELLSSGQLRAGDWLLVKGSRGMRLEFVVEQLSR